MSLAARPLGSEASCQNRLSKIKARLRAGRQIPGVKPIRPLTLCIAGAMLFAAPAAFARRPADVVAGENLARHNCGGCHAIGRGPSPFSDAPPFRTLWRRYPPGGLDRILEEGMLAPTDVQEEGRRDVHPRMPMRVLGEDEVDEVKAYLRSLDPRERRR